MQEIIAVTHLEDFDISIFEKVISNLPESKQKKIRKYRKKSDQYRSLIAEITVRTYFLKNLKLTAENLIFDVTPYGKPYLVGPYNHHYNVSHSGRWVTCIFDSSPVGIDVEEINQIDLEIAKQFFSRAEHEELFRRTQNEQLDYFFELWTLKESYIKGIGKGLSIPLDSFWFLPSNEGYQFNIEGPQKNSYFFKHYFIDPDYKLAVCSTHERFASAPSQCTGSEICFEFLALTASMRFSP